MLYNCILYTQKKQKKDEEATFKVMVCVLVNRHTLSINKVSEIWEITKSIANYRQLECGMIEVRPKIVFRVTAV